MKAHILSSKVRRRLAANLSRRRNGFAQRIAGGSAPRADRSAGPQLAATSERRAERFQASIAQLELELRRVDAALQRIEAGTFGTCCRCGYNVEAESLENDPATAFCSTCRGELAAKKSAMRFTS